MLTQLAASLLLTVFVPPHAAPPAVAPVAACDTKPQQAIAALLTDCEAMGFSGVVLVRKGTKKKPLFYQAYGEANAETGEDCTTDTLFEIASVTKPITATAFLHLADKKRIDLDASIKELLPGIPEHAAAITPRHLLLHRAGMPRTGPEGRGKARAAAVATYLSEPPAWAPGTRYEYWNGGYALLAAIVEEQSGKSFEGYVKKHIFGPAGMDASGFTGGKFKAKDVARGETPGQEPRLASDHPYDSAGWHYRGMGGVVTTAADLADFMAAFANGKLIPSKKVQEALTPNSDRRGLGWEVTFDSTSRAYRIEHGGTVRGFRSAASMTVGEELTVVVLSNRGNVAAERMNRWIRAAFQGNKAELAAYSLPPETARWRSAALLQLTGHWVCSDGSELTLTRAGARSLTAKATVDLVASVGSGAQPIHDLRTGFFATLQDRRLVLQPWEWKGVGSTLEWNGKKGDRAELTLATPDGTSRELRRPPAPKKGGH